MAKTTADVPDAQKPIAPPPPITAADPRIAASLAANPQAAGEPGTLFTYSGVGTPDNPGPGGTTNYGNPTVTQQAAVDPSADWASAFFGALGLPDDVMNQVTQILRDHAQDQTLAQALATQYIRSTSWYSVHYPGALEGIANGTIADEAGYTSYMNQLNVLSNQYNGRAISGDEVKGYLQAGYNPGYVANLYQGQAYVSANKPELQYLAGAFGQGAMSQDQLTAVGNESAGIDSPLGQLQQKIITKAQQIQSKITSGTLATPSLSLGTNGLSAPSLQGGTNASTPDVGA